VVEERGDVRREGFGRGEEFGRGGVVGSESPSEVLRDAESRERRDRWRAPDLPAAKRKEKNAQLCALAWIGGGGGVYLHCLYRVVGLRDAVDRQPLCRVWQKELIDDFYLVIGRPDGGETLSHVVDREKAQTTEAIETVHTHAYYYSRKSLKLEAKAGPRNQVRVEHVGSNLMTNLVIWLGPNKRLLGLSDQKMTRGRRKDITLPPSRALVIQRAYRDRKAKYLADLEGRCRKAEEENDRLRKELQLARSESAVGSINIELVNRGDYFFGKSGASLIWDLLLLHK
jgi:hypothetical protein